LIEIKQRRGFPPPGRIGRELRPVAAGTAVGEGGRRWEKVARENALEQSVIPDDARSASIRNLEIILLRIPGSALCAAPE